MRIEKPKITCGRLCILLVVLIITAPVVSAWWPKAPHFEEVSGNSPILLWKAKNTIHNSFMDSVAIGNIIPGIDTEVVSVEEATVESANGTPGFVSCISARRGDMGDPEWSYEFNSSVSSIALGDLDHDGYSEVICAVGNTGVFAFRGNGSIYWSYSRSTLQVNELIAPVVTDVLGNSGPEVIVPTDDGSIYVLNGTTGELLWSVDTVLSLSFPLAVGDINGDSHREIVLNAGNYTYAYTVGNSTPLWIHEWTSWACTAPIIADINGDGKADVVVATVDKVTALNGSDGSVLWHYDSNSNNLFTACAVGDLDGDGQLDVVAAHRVQLYALRGRDGSVLWTYSASYAFTQIDSISIGNFDDDKGNEIIISDIEPQIAAINGEDGSNDWYYYMTSSEILIQLQPAIGDVNNNGRLDLVVPCTAYGGHLGLYAIEPLSSGSNLYWNSLGGTGNYTHTNCLEDTDSDCDGLSNALEHSLGTNASSRDSDGDSIPDAWEYFHGFNPLDPMVPWNEFIIFEAVPLATVTVTMVLILTVFIVAKKKRWIGDREAENPPNVES